MHTLAGQVVWCESGGALMVDGLLVQPSVRQGVFADSQGPNVLHGAVINLFGHPRLSCPSHASKSRAMSLTRLDLL
ncbi:hypothetical protein SALBM311S_04674 [Streptomyces alboniger]